MKQQKKPILERLYILPVASGVLLALTLPPFNISLFAWFGFVPMLFFAACPSVPTKKVFEGGFIVGVIYELVLVYPLSTVKAWWWFDVAGIVAASKAIFLFWVLFFIVVCASALSGIFAALFKKVRRDSIIDAFIFAIVWTIFEYGRAVLFSGFTWGHIGYALHNELYIFQLAKFGGVYGLGFFVMFVNILVVLFVRSAYSEQFSFNRTSPSQTQTVYGMVCRAARNRFFYLAIFVLVAVNMYGYTVIHTETATEQQEHSVVVIQTGIETDEMTREGTTRVMELMRTGATDNPDVIILPENVFPFLFLDERTLLPMGYEFKDFPIKDFYDKLLALSREHKDTSFILGVHTVTAGRGYNSMIALENGVITDIYNKRFLMPFSEGPLKWIPYGPIGKLQAGNKETFSFNGIEVTPLICSEIIFPELVKRGISIPIVSIGNDSVFKSPLIAEENHIMARVRAAEHRVYVVRAMKTGISSIIDPHGRVIAVSKSKNEEILSADIKF